MNLKEMKIATIQNLNLIHAYELEPNFDESGIKYIGIRIGYNEVDQLDLSYRDAEFDQYLTKIIEQYNLEKNSRNIILLGDLTRKLFTEISTVLKERPKTGNQKSGLPAFNTSNRFVKQMEPYLIEAISTVLKIYKQYELLEVKDIQGIGKKYVANYNVGSVAKKMPLIISSNGDNQIDFKIGVIENSPISINGKLISECGSVYIDWKSDNEDTIGELIFESQTGIVSRKVETDGTVILYDKNKKTILEEDIDTLIHYLQISGINDISEFNVIKPNDNTFLLGKAHMSEEKEESLILSTSGIQMNFDIDTARIVINKKEVLSQYNGNFKRALSEEIEEISLRKIDIDSKTYVLQERKFKSKVSEPTFSYEVYEVDENVDLRKPFIYSNKYTIDGEITNIEKIKEYVKTK